MQTEKPNRHGAYPATMTNARYLAIARRLHSAYEALREAAQYAEHSQGLLIARAQDALRAVPAELRVQVCTQCSKGGYFSTPDDPYTSWKCNHPKVTYQDIRMDPKEKQR